MIEHNLEQHPDKPVTVSVKVIRKMSRILDRKVMEGTLISEHKDALMNRKGEWGQNLSPQF